MKQPTGQASPGAYYDRGTPAVVIQSLAVNDPAVVAESRRWSTGRRGAAVGEDGMGGIDLSMFVDQALIVGAHAIGTAGGVQDTFNLERLVSDVGARTAESTSRAVDTTTAVVNNATEAMQKASSEVRNTITEAGRDARRSFADTVEGARKGLLDEVHRLVGGDNPELAARLGPMLDRFGYDLDARVVRQTSELLDKAAKQFDPDDPTSPMAKHTRELRRQQETLSAALEHHHRDLATKVEELTTAVKVRAGAESLAHITPLKGESYATGIHGLMEQIAAGLGDEYADTGAIPGAIARNKKGDGVLTINGGAGRIVLEMTNSKRSNWNDYLDEAERNRAAAASLGLVPEPAQNNGSTIRCLGSRRIVMAFDPGTDDPELLRTVIQLLRLSALAASNRADRDGIHTAEEKIAEALGMLGKIDDIKKVAGTLRQHAGKIEQQSDDVRAALARLLGQTQAALSVAADAA
ncbi:MAG: Fis family transcriptional regulator [Pseudonocardiaceae bacterium]